MAFLFQFRALRQHVSQQLDTYGPGNEKSTVNTSGLMSQQSPSSSDELELALEIPGVSLKEDLNGHQYFEVGWAPDDPFNPQQWTTKRRVLATLAVCLIALATTMASAIDSAVIVEASKEFGVSETAESLATALYLIGFGVGALVASPLSEMVGRFPVYLGTLIIFGFWILGAALAPNFGAQIVFRFLAGFMGSSPLTVAGGSIGDLWNALERTFGYPIFAIPGFGGPVIGGYIGYSPHINWRWAEWTMLILDGLVILVIAMLKRETFAPQILYYKARFFRQLTGDKRFKTSIEASGTGALGSVLKRNFSRPWILAMEPIVMFLTFYVSIVYIVLFTFLDGYPFIFGAVYGINDGLTNICFLELFVGILLAMIMVPILYKKTQKQLSDDDGSGTKLHRESRLFFAQVGAPAIPIGLFWMGWTNYESISIWCPLAATLLIGFGIISVFLTANMYIIDSYGQYAASALAFVALVRYLAAGGMTVVGFPMYKNLGTHWTLTLLALLSLVVTPVPYVLHFWGPALRKKSKWAIGITP